MGARSVRGRRSARGRARGACARTRSRARSPSGRTHPGQVGTRRRGPACRPPRTARAARTHGTGGVGRVREDHVEPELIGAGEWEPGSVLEPVGVVELDPTEAPSRYSDPGARSRIGPRTSSGRMSSHRSPGQPFVRGGRGPSAATSAAHCHETRVPGDQHPWHGTGPGRAADRGEAATAADGSADPATATATTNVTSRARRGCLTSGV